ncbi:glutathione S-transferase family protein [Aestuariispira insulae]|uniref:Putative glutathione S-transferase n=1 Tax=Aestuariispira insulae TaxID=1461337 RepID=A0A3D9HE52_9PROT|nr:glutathione S-transferase C-terminal domain-containing protein [Aestuariispira insulae]RED47749.1 putative glutathione S-transferase [Aestuariispira insulae]
MAKMLINGQLAEKPRAPDGRFERFPSQYRHWISRQKDTEFPAETNRYHLFISEACPWCHRVMILRALMGLEKFITVTYMDALMGEEGWRIDPDRHPDLPGLYGDQFLYQTYLRDNPAYTGTITAPVLYDRKSERIVSTESSDIMRMFHQAFSGLTGKGQDLYPSALRGRIDRINDFVQDRIAEGVYRAGFATSQDAYDTAVDRLVDGLSQLEEMLCAQRYLAGERITEADWRLYPVLLRFDPVYWIHFKIGPHRIADYSNLSAYLRELHQIPGIAATVDMDHIRRHYFLSHRHLNPGGIMPRSPQFDLNQSHNREKVVWRRVG